MNTDLNAVFATKIMGWTLDETGVFWNTPDGRATIDVSDWEPSSNLRQLRKCYLMAAQMHGKSFRSRYDSELRRLMAIKQVELPWLFSAVIFEYPEIVAEAILNAAGVSVS